MIRSTQWPATPRGDSSSTFAPSASTADPLRFRVETSSLDELCTGLERAVDQGRRLLAHPGAVRGRAQDGGDDELRAAAVLLAERWEWGLRVLLDDATTLLHDLRAASLLYDEVERTAVPLTGPRAAP